MHGTDNQITFSDICIALTNRNDLQTGKGSLHTVTNFQYDLAAADSKSDFTALSKRLPNCLHHQLCLTCPTGCIDKDVLSTRKILYNL